MENFRGLPRHIKNLHVGNGFYGGVILEGPDDFFVRGDFDKVRGFAELAVADPIGHYGVSVGKAMQAGHEFQGNAGQVVVFDFPDDLFRRVRFEYLRGFLEVAAGDQRIAVGQA